MSIEIIPILLISFLATLVRSTLGFGESLVAVPLFLFFLPVEIAVPLSVMLSIVVALIIVVQDHSKIDFYSARWLVFSAVPGIPIGLALLIYGNDTLIKISLGGLIILYSFYSLFAKSTFSLNKDNKLWLVFFGFISGVLGGAYGLNGPPLVIYGNSRKWSPQYFRATLQAYFLPASLLGFTGYFVKGLVSSELLVLFGWASIAAIPAVFIGRFLNRRLSDKSFFRYVYWGLIAVGIVLVMNTLQGRF